MFKKYNHIFRTYSYLRLSVEDGDQIESDSIKNQRVIVTVIRKIIQKSNWSVRRLMMDIAVLISSAQVFRICWN